MSGKHTTPVIPADETGIAEAAAVLAQGGLVVIPTETVYGLAARADSDAAVARIYEAKGRPSTNPLIVHVRDLSQARRFGAFSPKAEALAKKHWPGSLTLVVPQRGDSGLAQAVTAGLPSVAIRVPAHRVAQAVLAQLDFPLAAPSANRSGFISPTSPEHVLASLDGRIDMVLDGGATETGVESTILAVRDDGSIDELRTGPVDGFQRVDRSSVLERIEAPGQLASHYAPGKPVRLDAREAEHNEFLIGFGPVRGDVSLSSAGDLAEAAARLYDCLHLAAQADKSRIAVAPVPNEGLGRAINDRLLRAAAPVD